MKKYVLIDDYDSLKKGDICYIKTYYTDVNANGRSYVYYKLLNSEMKEMLHHINKSEKLFNSIVPFDIWRKKKIEKILNLC